MNVVMSKGSVDPPRSSDARHVLSAQLEWIDHALPRTFFVRNKSIAKTTANINANPGRIRPSAVLDHSILLGQLMSRRGSCRRRGAAPWADNSGIPPKDP